MHARFFVPGPYGTGDQISLPDLEAHHLTRVLRLGPGDRVRVFDGSGHEFDAVVADAGKTAVRVHVGESRIAAAEARVAVTVAHAVLKGDKMDAVVRDAVMMGAVAIQPIVTARSEVTPSTLERGRRRERWTRVAVSSVKQCGRAVVPAIAEPVPFALLVDALRQLALPQPAFMFVEPSTGSGALRLADADAVVPRETTIIIGPEGGWAPEEIEQAAAVARLITLGGRTLRADAMATVAMAALLARWQEF